MKSINYVNFASGRLWTEAFGDPSSPLVVLVMGTTKQAVYWRASLCDALARRGYYVVRYDHRDTGLSTHINFNASPYRLGDLTYDLRAIIEYYDSARQGAHLVGCGMGGYLAQELAINAPEFIKSLVLLMSTYSAVPIEHPWGIHDLPSTPQEVLDQIEYVGRILPHDPNWFDKTMQIMKILNGADAPFDEEEWASLVDELRARINYEQAPAFFHHHLLAKTLSKLSFESNRIKQPTLIVHGSVDPIIPIEHAFATHEIIPNSKLVIINNMGHALPKVFYPAFIDAVNEHWDVM